VSLHEVFGEWNAGVPSQMVAGLVGSDPTNVTFNADGTITEVVLGVTILTTFAPDGSITRAFGAPVSRAVRTAFNADGSITETLL